MALRPRLLVALLVFALVPGLVACSSSEDDAGPGGDEVVRQTDEDDASSEDQQGAGDDDASTTTEDPERTSTTGSDTTDTTDGPDTTDTTGVTDTSGEGPDPSVADGPGDPAEYCRLYGQYEEQFAEAEGPTSEMVAAMESLVPLAPPEVRPDLLVVVGLLEEVTAMGPGIYEDPARIAELEALFTPEVEAAFERVESYTGQTCGIDE